MVNSYKIMCCFLVNCSEFHYEIYMFVLFMHLSPRLQLIICTCERATSVSLSLSLSEQKASMQAVAAQ